METPTNTPLYPAFNVPLDHNDIGWIGVLSVLWSQVEFLVEAGIYHFRGQTFDEGRLTTLDRDISKKLGVLSALAGDALPQRERRTFLGLCERAAVAAPKRNIAVHGNWMMHRVLGEPAAVSWFKVNPGDEMKSLPFSEVQGLAAEIATISRGLYDALEPRDAFADMAP